MPATKSKGRRKGKKGKKGKKALKILPEPLPLQILTDLYNQIDGLVRQLMDCRIIARKKRKETELMEKEQENMKRDDAVYREHINDLLLDVNQNLLDMRLLIDKERESIALEVLKVNAELQKKIDKTFGLIEEAEKKLLELENSLKELQPLRDMMAKTIEKLQSLMAEYERLRIEVLIKTTHLRNQYLNFRADLYNYMYEQLLQLISTVRLYLMPILWDHLEKMLNKNRCHRWDLIQIDERNLKLLEERNNLLKRVETLDGEEQYYGTEWAFVKLNDMRTQEKVEKLRWKNRLKEVYKHRNLTQRYKTKDNAIQERPPVQVVVDFREFLQKRLHAITEAKERQTRMERHRDSQKRHELLLEKGKAVSAVQRKSIFNHITRNTGASGAPAPAPAVTSKVQTSLSISGSSKDEFSGSLERSSEDYDQDEEGYIKRHSVSVESTTKSASKSASKPTSKLSIKERPSIIPPEKKEKFSLIPVPSTLEFVVEQQGEEEE